MDSMTSSYVWVIKDMMIGSLSNYFLHMSDITVDLRNNKLEVHNNNSEPWRVTMIDTAVDTMTGGRIKSQALRRW